VCVDVCIFLNRTQMFYTLSDIAKNHQVRKKYTIQLGENELVLKVSSYFSLFLFFLFIFLFGYWESEGE